MKVNLVLSGGGARGIAHLGIIKAIREAGAEINKISGVSSGAIAGAFIAAGYQPEEVLSILIETKLLYLIRPAFSGGIFKMSKVERILLKYFPDNSFESLKLPLIISATDINEAKTVYFSKGELIRLLLASCSVPGVFEPVLFNGHQLIDGGVINNLPVDPFLDDSLPIIACHVNPLSNKAHISSAFRVIERSVLLSIHDKVYAQKKYAQLFIEPDELEKFSVFGFEEAKEIFDIGYRYASGMKEKLLSLTVKV